MQVPKMNKKINVEVLVGIIVGIIILLFSFRYRQRCFTFAQHFKVKCHFGTQFFPMVLVAQGIRATGFKHTQSISLFTFKSANTLALCQSKATLPYWYKDFPICSLIRKKLYLCHWDNCTGSLVGIFLYLFSSFPLLPIIHKDLRTF